MNTAKDKVLHCSWKYLLSHFEITKQLFIIMQIIHPHYKISSNTENLWFNKTFIHFNFECQSQQFNECLLDILPMSLDLLSAFGQLEFSLIYLLYQTCVWCLDAQSHSADSKILIFNLLNPEYHYVCFWFLNPIQKNLSYISRQFKYQKESGNFNKVLLFIPYK